MAATWSGAFDTLCQRLGQPFPAISAARSASAEVLMKLEELTRNGAGADAVVSVVPPDTSVVLFGSLARREWTAASDVDWTLLVDGQADPQHRRAAQEFERRLEQAEFKKPGPAGVFGSVCFSHELIHCIGGEQDSNRNMTQRILLLLESASLSKVDAHSRVMRGILRRYLESERSFFADTGRRYKVPRFLLNDIVRYWRTVAVDYVNKQWERGDQRWAVRNIKLRFSRKLLFVSGLLTCFSCYLDQSAESQDVLFKDPNEAVQAVQRHLAERLGTPPIDVLCTYLARGKKQTAIQVLESYNTFLMHMKTKASREELAKLRPEDAYSNDLFQELRKCSSEFQAGLNTMFYHDNPTMHRLMLKYGVF